MANDVSDALLKAMSIVANQATSNQSADISIKAIIKSRVDSSTGQYLATYNGGDITIFDIAASTNVYSPGTQVYALVPEGNFSNKKYIIGAVSNEDASYSAADDTKLSNYNIVGKNCVIYNIYFDEDGNKTSLKTLSLNSKKKSDSYYCYTNEPNYLYNTSEYPTIDIDFLSLAKNLENCEAILVKADFRTMLPANTYGNYGLIICVSEDESGEQKKYYNIDATTMTGNPMNYVFPSNQYVIIPVSNTDFFKINSIVAFSEGFVAEDVEDSDSDIFIENIEIYALNEQIVVNGNYKFMFNTMNGNCFDSTSADEKISVEARLLDNGVDVSDEATYYWGIQDNRITPKSDEYNPILGNGYAYLKEKKNKKSFVISGAECLAAENKFKCAVEHRSKKMSQEFILYNNSSFVDFKIESSAGNVFRFEDVEQTILTCTKQYSQYLIEGTEEIAEYQELENPSYEWSVIQQDGSQFFYTKSLVDTDNAPQNDAILSAFENIDFPQGINGPTIILKKLTGNFNRYCCSVYSNNKYVGRSEILLKNKTNDAIQNCYIRIDGNNQVVQYDENGNISNTTGKMISPKLVDSDTDTIISGYTVKWVFPANNTLIIPPQSSIKNNDVFTYDGNEYELKYYNKYDSNATNNIIQVILEYQGNTYTQNVSLLFTKIGANGTNGTSTVVKINELIKTNGEKLAAVYSNGSWKWNDINSSPLQSTPAFEAALYDNDSIQSGLPTSWNWLGKTNNLLYISTNGSNAVVCGNSPTGIDISYRCQTLQAEVTDDKKQYYGCYNLPTIEYQDGYNLLNSEIQIIESECLNEVIYKSNGGLPTYDTNKGAAIKINGLQEPTVDWFAESGPYYNSDINCNYMGGNFKIAEAPNDNTGSFHIQSTPGISEDVIDFVEEIRRYQGKDQVTDSYIEQIFAVILSSDSDLNKYQELCQLLEFEQNNNDTMSHVDDIKGILKPTLNRLKTEQDNLNDFFTFFNEIKTDIVQNWNTSWPNILSTTESNYNLSNAEILDIFKPNHPLNERKLILTKQNNQQEVIDTSDWKNVLKIFGYDEPSFLAKDDDEVDLSGNIIETFIRKNVLKISNIKNSLKNNLPEGVSILEAYENILNEFKNEIFSLSLKYEGAGDLEDGQSPTLYENAPIDAPNSSGDSGVKENFVEDIIEDSAIKDYNAEQMPDGGNASNETSSAVLTYDDFIREINSIFLYYQKKIISVNATINVSVSWYNNCKKYLTGNSENNVSKIYVIPNKEYNGIYCNNNIVANIYDRSTFVAKVTIPIYIHMNQYELSSINGWDGTSIEIDENSGYMLAPQIGAGIKNNVTNTFTGVVMGALSNPTADGYNIEDKIGLMGFKDGKQSIFLDAKTGKAVFGLAPDQGSLSDGRIELVPGGVSTIANWKIGQSFLYNIPNGTYEVREDEDDRDGFENINIMVPHDKSGIILSANNPYISIKGKTFTEKEIATFIQRSEYENINPKDSFEVRLNPANNSLFSIMHHSDGLAGHDVGEIKFGVIENHREQALEPQKIINFKNDDEHGPGCLFVTFLIEKDDDGNPIPFSSHDTYYFTNTGKEEDGKKVIILSETTVEPRQDNGYNGDYVLKIYPDFINTEIHPYIDFIEIDNAELISAEKPEGNLDTPTTENSGGVSDEPPVEEPVVRDIKYFKYIRTLNTKAIPLNDSGVFEIGDNQRFSREQLESDVCLNWQEYIRVGIDDTGQLMNKTSTGVQVNNRLSRINAFGQMAGLYGQQLSYIKDNQPVVLLKIISNDADNTYITAGADDNKTINILTSDQDGEIIIGHCGDVMATADLTAPSPQHGLAITKDGVYIIKAGVRHSISELL